MNETKVVELKDFEIPERHENVESIVFRISDEDGCFYLGFLPKEGEFKYFFKRVPDVFFQGLPFDEVYFEPYRTFIRLNTPAVVDVAWLNKTEWDDKLYVLGEKLPQLR